MHRSTHIPRARRTRRTLVAAAALLTTVSWIPRALRAQTCYGTPRRGGLAFERGNISFGHSNGVGGAIAGNRFGLGANYRHYDRGPQTTGNGGLARFALIFNVKYVQVCPGLSVDFEREQWQSTRSGTLTSNQLTGRAGVGVGGEIPVYGALGVMPFVVAQYAFRTVAYDLNAPNTNAQLTGDTTSTGDIEYGLLAHYSVVYGGVIGDHYTEKGRPYRLRFVIGLTVPTSGTQGGARRSARRPDEQ